MRYFPLNGYRNDAREFIDAACRWTLIRWYAAAYLAVIIPIAGITVWFMHADATRPVTTVTAVVTESSRPLTGEVKAPADWTGDGAADGWLPGEWLPGDTGTAYLHNGEQVSAPTSALGYIIHSGFLLIAATALLALPGYIMFDSAHARAWRLANQDWTDATRLTDRTLTESGIPVWVR